MDSQNQRNMILAIVMTALILFGWDAGMRYLYPNANKAKPTAAASASSAPVAPGAVAPDPAASGKPTREGGLTSAADQALEAKDLQTALNPANRVPIQAPGLSGSINLAGGVVDDLVTNRHTASVEKNSGPQRIYSPAGTPAQQFAQFGWVGQNVALPGGNTVWTVPAGARLTPQTPVTLSWNNGAGLIFTLTYAIDADYMLTVSQAVSNTGAAPVAVQPFALINRTDKTMSTDIWNLHSGPFGAFDGKVQFEPNYKDVTEKVQIVPEGKADWVGFTDIYWMSTLIPDRADASASYRAMGGGIYRADLIYPVVSIAPGKAWTRQTRLFAGAKESKVLDAYEATGIKNFSLAIDWGWFRWFEKPILLLLKALFKAVGNFGVAIMLLTVIVRGVMFPVAQRQFASMAAMKSIQPKMKAIQDRYKDDKPKQQEEIMALYKKEGVNPLAGCLPIFLQMPVFFALYKVLTLAIEMRHQPFVLWLKDLSAPDPLHLLNLFGLLPFTPPAFLGIGILALLLGITMWLQFKLNPAQMDPTQQQVMGIMPWMMMFIMAPFASGLLLYWITSNVLTIAQQKWLYSRHPQLQAQTDKDAVDFKRAKERG